MTNDRKHLQSEGKEERDREVFTAAADGLIIIDLESGLVIDANPVACAMHAYSRSEFSGLHPERFIHPGSLKTFKKHLRTFRPGGVFTAQVLHMRGDGTTFHAEWRATEFTSQHRSCLLGIVRDVSERIKSEQQLQKRIKSRTREQFTLLEISHTLASTLELQPELILDQLRGIIQYTNAVLFGLDDSTLTAMAVRRGTGTSPGRAPRELELSVPFQVRLDGPEVLAALFNGHRPIRLADIWSSDPKAVFLQTLLNGTAAVLLEGMQSWMWVPLAVRGRVIGGLGVAHTRRNFFTAHHAALALSMADQVAITMVNAGLYEKSRVLAALQERQRLAQNLHDAVNQSLFSAGLIAEVLPRLWDRDQVTARQSLEDLRRLTRGAQAEMRALLAELRPSVLTDSSLGDLLRQLANAFTGRTNIPVSLNIPGEHILPPEIQVAFYRICQESLNNIARHAGASHVVIDLQHDTEVGTSVSSVSDVGTPKEIQVRSTELHIRDNGHGFDTAEITSPGHYGLSMMRERAEAMGARLNFTSHPGQGTDIYLRWPGTSKQEA